MTEDLLKPNGVNYFDQYDSAEEEVAPGRTSPLVDELTGDMMFQGAFERLKQRDALQKSEEDSRDSITVVTEDDTIRELYAKGQQVQNGYSQELGAFIEAEKAQNQEQIAERSKGLTELSKGFTQGTLGATSMLGAALRQHGESSGSETLGRVGEFVQYLSELERAKVAPPRVNQFGDVTSFNDFMDYFWAKLGEAGGSTTGIIAGGAVGGIPGAGLVAMNMGWGEVRNELEAVGVTDPKMLERYSYVAGFFVGALDSLVPVSVLSKLTGNSKRELAKYMVRRIGAEIAKGTGKEGLTEALQETVIIAASSAAQGEQNFIEIMRNAKDGIVAQRERIGEAALAGMIGGSGFGTVSGVGQEFTRPRTEDQVQRETKQDMDPFAEFFRAQPIRTTAMEERLAGQEGQSALKEPPIPNGMIRVYHSGEVGEGETGRWVSTNKEYASNYRSDLPLFYLDIPANDPRVNDLDYPEQSASSGFVFNFETTPEEAARLRQISRENELVKSKRRSAPEDLVQAPTYAESREKRAGDVLQFIRSRGGLKPAGELEGLDANRYPGLVNQKGLSADQMREQLVEAGYLEESGPDQPAVTTPADVYDLVQRAISGERIVPADMQQQDQAAFEAEDQRTYEANLAHDEQVMVLADIDAADQEYGDTGFRDLYLRMPRAQRIEAIERIRSGEDTLDVIEEMTLRGDNIAEVASMMARRGLSDEQTARLREIVSEQAPDLIDGLDELLAVLPKRQKREAAARTARGGREQSAAPVQQATAPAQQQTAAAVRTETVSSLMRKTKPELVSLARERGVPVKAKATKQQIAADVMAKAERDKREPAQREQAPVIAEPVESLSPEAEIVAENLNALFHRGDRNGDIEAWLEESREIVAELQRLPAREAVNVAVDFMGELPAAVRRSRAASARAVQQRFDSLYNSWAMARHVSMPSMAEQGAFTDDTIINELDDAIWRAALAMTPERVRKQMQDRITLTQVAPNIMLNANGQSPVTESEAFRRWFADSKVVDENGLPLIVYHGTTHDIEIFRPVRANFENDFGAGYYFSNSTADVRENYAGMGPDLTQRIELQAERIMFEIENVIDSDGIDAALEQFGLTQEQRSENIMEMAREVARRELSGGAPNTVPVYLSFQNPVILGGTGETYIGSGLEVSDERRDEIREDVLEETKEQNLDEYEIEELIMQRIDEELSFTEPTSGVAGMITHIRSLDYADMDPDGLADDLVDYMDEGGRAADIIEIMKRSEGLAYATDDNGALVSSEVIRSALEAIGYDGIIDRTVNEKFGSESGRRNPMAGMDENTVHYIAFKPTQIKSAIGNRGTFDPNDPRIVFSVDSNSELLLTVDQRSVDEEQVRRGVKTLLAMGRSVSISGNVRAAIFNNIRSSRAVIPRNLPVGYLSRIEPGKNKRVKAHFTMEDGSSHVMEIGREQLLGLRAFYQSSNGALPRGIYFARFNTSGKIAPSFIGELRHESIHALRRGNLIPDKVWSQLVSHAKNLRVLDVVNSDYLEATGRKATDESATFLTLNDIYNDYYQGRADLDETLDQEAVAHMAELYSHGIWEQSEIAPVQAILDGIFAGQYSGNPQQMFSIRGFHGSPHDFDRFDMSRIGTGEGAQAFGHGLYFAENEMVAGTYRDNLSAQTMTINGFPFQPRNHAITQIVGRNLSDLKAARQELAQYAEQGADNPYSDINDAYRIIDAIDEGIFDVGTQGALYEVEIDVEPEQLLDWDLPLSKQGAHVQEFFDSALAEDEVYQAWKRNGAIANVNASLLYDRLSGPRGMQRGNVDGRETASQKLREAGIPGIRYLDQGSRRPGFSSLTPAQLDARIETLRSDIASGQGDQEKMRARLADLERERDSYPALTRNIVIFDDSLVKITKKNGKPVTAKERQDAIDQMFSLRGFYSPAIRAAEQLKQERGTGQQFWSMISKAPGVRRDELDWMGLEEFLADKTSITRDEVLAFMRAHQVELDEKILGTEQDLPTSSETITVADMPRSEEWAADIDSVEKFTVGDATYYIAKQRNSRYYSVISDTGYELFDSTNLASAQHEAIGHYGSKNRTGTRFSGNKVPGGENYREMLIRLPQLGKRRLTDAQRERLVAIEQEQKDLQPQINEARFGSPERNQLIDKGSKLVAEQQRIMAATEPYTSRHFYDSEIVHLRVDDRAGPNGEKVLFVNEIQSDLHQKGRKKGYKSKDLIIEEAEHQWLAKNKAGKQLSAVGKGVVKGREEATAYLTKYVNENRVPDAPFKGDLWLELALKRALLYASENGYDAVSWARSDQIAKAVGGDAEALSVQYDQKIGRFLSKYTKKWGGKVERTEIDELDDRSFDARLRQAIEFAENPPEGQEQIAGEVLADLRQAQQRRASGTTEDTVYRAMSARSKNLIAQTWGENAGNPLLRITPEMRSSVMEGQPLTIRRDPNERQPIVEGLFDREKLLIIISRAALDPVSTLYHESIHALRTLGLFTPSEWKVLTAAAKAQGWLDVPEIKDYQRIYGKPATDENIIEEAVAMAFQRYMRGQQQQPGTIVERLFERVRVFFERVRSAFALRGWAAAEDVFAAVAGGQVADRDGPMGALVEEIENITKPMLETAGRMADSPARVAQPGLDRPGQSLATLVRRFNRGLGLIVRQGRLSDALKKQAAKAGRRLGGHYNTVSGVIRLRILNELDTLAHEGGHALEGRHKTALEAVKLQYSAELLPLASPGPDALSEGFAEWFRRYITNPAASRRTAPRFEQAFEAFMQRADPRALKNLQNIRTGYQEWLRAPSAGVIVSHIVSRAGGQLAKFRRIVQEGEVRETIDMFVEKMYTWVIDDLHPIRQTVEGLLAVASKNLNLPNDARLTLKVVNDPYKLLRLARDGYASGHMDLQHGVRPYHQLDPAGPSFHEVLVTAFGGESRAHWRQEAKDRFDSYLASRRMVREWDRYFNGELTALPDKVKKTEHLQNITELERAYPGFAQAAQMLYQFQNNMLQKKLDAGLISQEIYDTLIGRPDYVPVLRDRTDLGQVHIGAPARADKQGILRRFRGSQRDIISPLESIVQDTYDTAMIIARNDAIKALDTLARAAGPDGGAFAERIPSHEMQGTKVNVQEALRLAAREAGVDPADLQAMVQSVDDMLGDNAITTIWRAGEISEKGEAIVYLWEKGKRIPIRLADKEFGRDMLNSILALGSELTPWYISVLSLPATILRTAITASLDFIGVNFLRGEMSAWTLVDEYTPFVSGIKGIQRYWTSHEVSRIYSSVGGLMGGANTATLHNARIKQEVLDLRKRRGIYFRDAPLSNILRMTEFTETANRLGIFEPAFKRAQKDGLSKHEAAIEAAYAARDYIDFGRHGSKTLAARKIIPFWNAALQGLDRTIRGMRGKVNNDRILRDQISPYIKSRLGQPLSIAEKRQLPLSAKVWAKMIAVGMFGLALSLLYRDDEEYEEFSEYMRATHWIFKWDGEWYRYPKHFELATFSNLFERAFEYAYKGDPLALERFVRGLQYTILPPTDVPGIKLPFELAFNYDAFTERPIVADHLRALPPHLQFNAYASEFGKAVGKQINVSPAYVDHFITGFGASYGRAFLNGTDALTGNYIDPGTATKDIWDALIGRRFSLEAPRGAQSISQFWDLIGNSTGTYAQAANGYKHYLNKARDPLAASEFLAALTDDQKAYAILHATQTGRDRAKYRDLHPLIRAEEVVSIANALRKSLNLNRLEDQDGEALVIRPRERRMAMEILGNLQMREARNGLVAAGVEGWAQKQPMDTQAVIEELAAAAPAVHEQFMEKLREAKLPSYEDVRRQWPEVRRRLIEDGENAELSDLYVPEPL